jgi:hypothetical protein
MFDGNILCKDVKDELPMVFDHRNLTLTCDFVAIQHYII